GAAVRALAFEDGELGRAAHAEQQPGAVDNVVDRDRKVERRQTVCAKALGDEEGIGQDVAGRRDHAEGTQRSVARKGAQRGVVHGFLLVKLCRTHKKTPCFASSKAYDAKRGGWPIRRWAERSEGR